MSLTPQQLAERKNYIGASESAAVLGLSPFQSAADLYFEKVGDVEPRPATEAMESGTRLEPVIIDWCAARLGVKALKDCPSVRHATLPLGATPDARIANRPMEIIEAKKTSMVEGWGAEGTDEIPEHYQVQAHQQMFVLGVEKVWVPVLMLTGFREEWRLYCVRRDEDLGADIARRVSAWWQHHVVARVPPANAVPDESFLKRLRRQPASTVILGEQALEVVSAWDKAKALLKTAEEAKDNAQAAMLALLGVDNPAEAGQLPDGRTITYLQQRNPPSVDKERLRAGWPDAFEQCVTQTMRRQLRVKKAT